MQRASAEQRCKREARRSGARGDRGEAKAENRCKGWARRGGEEEDKGEDTAKVNHETTHRGPRALTNPNVHKKNVFSSF